MKAEILNNPFVTMERELQFKYDACNKFVRELDSTQDSLPAIIEMHKRIWKHGVQHPSFGPDNSDECVMLWFHTKDILSMTPDEILIGTLKLSTNTASYWESRKNHDMSELEGNDKPAVLPEYYREVCGLYKSYLKSNLMTMMAQVFDNGIVRESLCQNIVDGLNKIGEFNQSGDTSFREIEILNKSISNERIIRCRITREGFPDIESSFLYSIGRILLPEGFQKGVIITKANAQDFKYQDIEETLYNDGAVNMFSLEPFARKILREASTGQNLTRSEAKENIANVRKAEKLGSKYGI